MYIHFKLITYLSFGICFIIAVFDIYEAVRCLKLVLVFIVYWIYKTREKRLVSVASCSVIYSHSIKRVVSNTVGGAIDVDPLNVSGNTE